MRMTSALLRPFLVIVASVFLLFAGGQAREAQAAVPTLSCTPPGAEPEIAALARALNYNLNQIYEYVYYNIDYSPTWGSKKGALVTYLDHRGNNIDQNVLFVALLRQSCITANFRYGAIAYAPAALANLFGIDNDAAIFNNTLANGGFSACVEVAPPACTNTGGAPQQVAVDVVWTEATVGSTTYELDPSFKSYAAYTPIDIGAAMGYAQGSFLSDALGGSSAVSGLPAGVNSIRAVNKSQITSLLNGYAQKLADYIRANKPTSSAKALFGGREITNGEYGVQYNAGGTLYTDLPAAFETVYTVTVSDHADGSSPTISNTLYASQIAGKRLTLFYNASSQPVLALDGAVLGTGAAAAGATQTVSMTVQNPYPAGDSFATWTVRPQVKTGGAFALMLVAGEMDRDQLTRHQNAVAHLRKIGSVDTSEPLLGESLAAIGTAYLSQSSRVAQNYAQYFGFTAVRHEAMGIAGKTSSGYVDFPAQISSVTSARTSTDTNTLIGGILGTSIFNSSLESTAVKQMQDHEAVSTVRMFDYSNGDGTGFIEANPSNWSSVKAALVNWSAADLAEMTAFIQSSASSQLLLPQNGKRTVGSWSGNGYYEINSVPGNLSIAYKISGGYSGGFGTWLGYDNGLTCTFQLWSTYQLGVERPTTQDPIDLLNGSFQYSKDDLKAGSGDFPFSLAIKRDYDSSRADQKTDLGYGWRHNFMMTAAVDSDSYEGFGDHNPLSAVPTEVALFVIKDLSSQSQIALQNVTVSSLVASWLMDQLVDNAVTLTVQDGTTKFTKIPTASGGAAYVPPPGSASSIVVNTDKSIMMTDKSKNVYSFDTDGKLASWKDPNGNAVSLTYSGTGAAKVLHSVSNGMGRTLTFTYTSGRLTNVGDGTTSVTYAYDSAGNLANLTDQRNHTTKYLYDTASRLTQIFYPSFPSTAFVTNAYDALGKVQKQTDALGNVSYLLFANGERSEEINPAGGSRILYYDRNGNHLEDTNPLGEHTFFAYDGIGRPIKTTYPLGDSVVQTYDAASNVLTRTTNPFPGAVDVTTGQPPAPIVEKWTYDSTFNKVLTHADGRGAVTTNAYDTKGNLIKVTQPVVAKPGATSAAPVTTYTYNARGQVLGQRDPEGTLTTHAYDATTFDLLSTTVDADSGHLNLTTSYTYNARGDKATETNPRGLTTTYTYDAGRNLLDVRPPAPFTNSNVTDYGYDADNRQTTVSRYVPATSTQAARWLATTTTYNAAGKVSTVTNPDGTKKTTTYDSLGRVATETSSSGRQVVHKYDAVSNPTQLIDTVSGTLDPSITVNFGAVTRETRTYYAGGLLASLADSNGNALTYKYDGFKRLAQVVYPDSTYELHALDANGNETTTRTRSGDLIQFTYDALNRKITKAPAGEESVTYGYDFAGRMLSAKSGTADYTFGYDTAGRQVSATRPWLGTVSWTLDANGNRSSLSWPGTPAWSVTYVYDARDRLAGVYTGAQSADTRVVYLTYDSLSQRAQAVLGTGTSGKATTKYAWTLGGQPAQIAHAWSGGGVTIDYGYNQDHQRTSATWSDDTFLPSGLAAASPAYVPNTLNQYGSVGGTAYGYDANGNLTSDGVWTYGYDSENRLVSAKRTAPSVTATYTYDPLGRRASKTVNGVTTRYLPLGDQEIAEYTGSTPVLDRRYVYGAGLDEPVATVTAAGAVSYHLADGLGSMLSEE
ncbi:DUF6531 domain-containing protein [Inquilinus sp. NPDC058860]|uniref:DUF6531 domain-containing protein n=1 Tax=Inquilinus sp. NPDC058860 TaxID=3346652 RepID=UPI00367FF4E1